MGFIYTKKVILDNYKFDSQMEADFYILLKKKLANKEIRDLQIHPKFILQEAFMNGDKRKHEAIIYEADFSYSYVGENNIEVVDVKGMLTDDFCLKWKMYDFKFGNGKLLYTPLRVLKYSKTTGWVDYDEYKTIKRGIVRKLKRENSLYRQIAELQELIKIKDTKARQVKLEKLKNELKEIKNG